MCKQMACLPEVDDLFDARTHQLVNKSIMPSMTAQGSFDRVVLNAPPSLAAIHTVLRAEIIIIIYTTYVYVDQPCKLLMRMSIRLRT